MSPDPIATMMATASRFTSAREEESLFARDDDDVVVRKEKETRDRFRDMVTVVIDGYKITVPKAVPKTDPQGNQVREADGGPAPRTTTIYDAAAQLFDRAELGRRIPVLCHQPHQNPVAVCRMCSVQISNPKKGRPERKLLPACQHPVEDGMQVTTRCGGAEANPESIEKLPPAQRQDLVDTADYVRKAVGVLAEFLLADHRHAPLSPATDGEHEVRDGRYRNELEDVADALGVRGPRRLLPRNKGGDAGRNGQNAGPHDEAFAAKYARARRVELPIIANAPDPEVLPDPDDREAWVGWNDKIDAEFPYSSRTVVVDHDRCILCDRCVRACSEDKPFKIIGHTGKGYNTRISFDLDKLMGESDCVQCGQCMTYCPTGALSLRRRVQPRAWGDESPKQIPQNPNTPFPDAPDTGGAVPARFLTADEMLAVDLGYVDPLTNEAGRFRPFEHIPFTFLKWNEGAVRERELVAGESEILCEAGTYGTTAFLLKEGERYEFRAETDGGGGGGGTPKAGLFGWLRGGTAAPRPGKLGPPIVRTADDLILGEMACMTADRRTGRITAVGPAVWYEVTRNVLDMIQRTPANRKLLDRFYTPRATWTCLDKNVLFKTALGKADRDKATAFLRAVNQPAEWVYARHAGQYTLTDGEVADLWEKMLADHRTPPGEPVTAVGFEAREALAKFVETSHEAIGLAGEKEGRRTADDIRLRRISPFVAVLPTFASQRRVLRELVGAPAVQRWFPDLTAEDPRPGRLLKYLLVSPGRGRSHQPPPPGLARPALEFLLRLNQVQLLRVDPGQAIVSQDDPASDFYMIRLGFVRVQTESGGVSIPVAHRGREEAFGEVGLLDRHPAVRASFPPRGQRRSASVVALDPVEVVRIRGPVFHMLCARVPAVEAVLLTRVTELLAQGMPKARSDPGAARERAKAEQLPEFLQLGLYQGQKLLVLDLKSCTRCDECTRACADSHSKLDGGAKHARLLREGMRFGDFLVATSCRSCHKPYCMDGCPVDAIHRQGARLEVVVENHCIGCGLCERNCPYGSIHMVPRLGAGADRVANPPRRAVNCDLCGPVGGDPYCVSACPHETAFRMSGEELLDEVLDRLVRKS